MNRRFVLASRPDGEPSEEHFRLESGLPIPEPGAGEMLVKNSFLSIDPYMRGRMSDRASYAKPVAVGELMVGGTVGTVTESKADGFSKGDTVVGYGGWQEWSILRGSDRQVLRVDPRLSPSAALGVCGMPGATAYFGLHKVGEPKAGETLVVSAASGAVGSIVGQLGKRLGCRVVGVAGGKEKCDYVVKDLGFDACVDRRDPAFERKLAEACPRGVDVYFENVGGMVLEAVAKLLNPGARVPICGIISQYNEQEPSSPFTVLGALSPTPVHRFFLVWEWPEEYAGVIAELTELFVAGQLRYREDVAQGLEAAPRALRAVLRGENFGKMVVKLAP